MDLNDQQQISSHRAHNNSVMMNYQDADFLQPSLTNQMIQMQNPRGISHENTTTSGYYSLNQGNYKSHPHMAKQQNQNTPDAASQQTTQRDPINFQNVTSSTPAKELSSLALTTQPDDEFTAGPGSSAKVGNYHNQNIQKPVLQHLAPVKKPSTPDRQQQSYSFIQRGNRSIKSANVNDIVPGGHATARGGASNTSEDLQLIQQSASQSKWDDSERTQAILALCIEMTLESKGNNNKRDANGGQLQDQQSQNEILGLVQVLKWRISSIRRSQRGNESRRQHDPSDIVISQKEFNKLYGEWLARKGVSTTADGSSNFMSLQSMLESSQALCLNDIKVQLLAILKKLQVEKPEDWAAMADLLGNQLNRQLRSASLVTEEWITKAEEIWNMIVGGSNGSDGDGKRMFLMTPIGSQNLLLSLLLNEITESNIENMPILVRRQTGQLMRHLNQQEGVVIQRFYKQYLLQQGLTSTNDLGELRDNVQGVLKTMSEVFQQWRYKNSGNCYDILELLLEECIQNESNRDLLKFSSTDIWQGLYYLINQGMLRNAEGNPLLIGTWIESEAAIAEMAQRLGQYMYVLNQQQMGEAQIQALGSAKQVMKMYGKILEKLLLAFDRDSTRLLKQVCDLLLAQKTMIAQSSNTLVPQSSAISDFVNNNGGGAENSHSRLSHQTSHSEKGKNNINNREQERFDDDNDQSRQQELHDFSAQVIKENNLLKEKTTKTQQSVQRNEPYISGIIGTTTGDEDTKMITEIQSTPEHQQQQIMEQVTPSSNYNNLLGVPLQVPPQAQVNQTPGKLQFSTISIQDQQRQSMQSDRSGQNNLQRSVGPTSGPSHALQLSFQNTAVYQNHGSISTAFSGAPATEVYQNEERRPSGLPSGPNSQLPSHNNSILQSQQMAQPSGQGHPVNQSMMSYKSNYSNMAAPNMSLQPGDQMVLQGPFRTHTNSNFNTNQSKIINNQSTSQDYRTFGNAPREATQSPHMQRNNPASGSRLAVNPSQMKVKKGSQIDLHQLASRHGHNDSIRQHQQMQQQNGSATARRHHEQNQGYKGPVIQDSRRSKNSSITSGANAATKKSQFPGVSPASKSAHQHKVGQAKTRSRVGSTRMNQMNNNPQTGIGALSQNCSVNQSISVGGGALAAATSHASNHGGADRSPIRMRNVEDYSQVMQRLKQQGPNGNNTPKLSRNKVQKATTERMNLATSHDRQKAGDRRHSQNLGSVTHRPATQQQQYQQPQMYSQNSVNHHSSENLAQRQKIQPGAWIADRAHNTQAKQMPGPGHQSQQQQVATQRWQDHRSPNLMLSSSVKSRGASSNRDGSAASFGRANYKSNESGAMATSSVKQAWQMAAQHQKPQQPLIPFQPQRPASQLHKSHPNQFAALPPHQSSSFEQLQPYPTPEVEEENYVSGGGAKTSPAQGRQLPGPGLKINDAWSTINRSTINSSKSIGVTGKRQHPIAAASSQSSTSFSPYPGSGSGMNSAKEWRLFPVESELHPYHGSGQGYHGERQVNLRPHNAQGSSNKNINPSISRLNNVSTSKSSFLHQQSLQGMQAASQIGFPGSGNYFNIHSNKQLQSSLSSISQTTITNGGGGANHSRDGISQQEMESILAHQRMLSGKQSHPSFRIQQQNSGQQIAWPQKHHQLSQQKQQNSMIQRQQPYLF